MAKRAGEQDSLLGAFFKLRDSGQDPELTEQWAKAIRFALEKVAREIAEETKAERL